MDRVTKAVTAGPARATLMAAAAAAVAVISVAVVEAGLVPLAPAAAVAVGQIWSPVQVPRICKRQVVPRYKLAILIMWLPAAQEALPELTATPDS